MPTDTVSIAEFVKANRIRIAAERTDSNPNNPDWHDADHWKCVLTTGGAMSEPRQRMTVYFSKGYGHKGAEPTAEEVLHCLASDSAGIENARDFEDFCSEYGYDSDSRKAEKIYKACEHTAKRLRNFLGSDLYEQLLWNTERL